MNRRMEESLTHGGYSGNPLEKKLGLKDGQNIGFYEVPQWFSSWITQLPIRLRFTPNTPEDLYDYQHVFVHEAIDIEPLIQLARGSMKQNGMIWVSWPKKSSKVRSDVSEGLIRQIALANALVDVKVCSINEIYSGLKLVIRIKDRKPK